MQSSLPPWTADRQPWQNIARHVNQIIDQINTNSSLLAGGSTTATRVSGAGVALAESRREPVGRGLIVKITAPETGTGKYGGHLFSPNCQTAPATNLIMPEGLTDSGNTNALVLNLLENSPATTHLLGLNTFHIGLLAGYTTEAVPRAVILICAAWPAMFPVQVKKDGGADGTQTTPATWTYTVLSLDGGQTLGSLTPLARPRPNGSRVVQTALPAFGMAFYSAGQLMLWDAGEIPATTACT